MNSHVFNTSSISLSSLPLSHLPFALSLLCFIDICEENVYSVLTFLDSSIDVGGEKKIVTSQSSTPFLTLRLDLSATDPLSSSLFST